MIKVLNSSSNLTTWYLDPGIPFGDGTQEHPYYWDAVCDEERTGISGTVSSSSNQYYKILLKSGTTYTFRYNKDGSWDGDMRISFYDTDGTTIRDSWDSDPVEQFDYTPTKDGLCTLRIQPYSSYSGSFKYLVTPAPEQFVGNPGWKKKTIIKSSDVDDIGYLLQHQMLEDARINFSPNTNDEFSKLFISFDENISDSAKGNPSPLTLNIKGGTVENGFGIFNNNGIDCSASNFDFANINKWTVDFYINFSSLPTSDSWSNSKTIFVTYDSASSSWQNALRFGNNNINFQYEDSSWIISAPMTMVINKWYYFALVRNDNTYYMFINGEKVAEATNSYNLPNYPNCQLFYEADGSYFTGKIKNFNISFGISRYLENFIPPKVSGIELG